MGLLAILTSFCWGVYSHFLLTCFKSSFRLTANSSGERSHSHPCHQPLPRQWTCTDAWPSPNVYSSHRGSDSMLHFLWALTNGSIILVSRNITSLPENLVLSLGIPPPSLSPRQPLGSYCPHSFTFSRMSRGIVRYWAFSDWLLPRSHMHWRWLTPCLFVT